MDAQLPRGTVVTGLPVRIHFDGACEPPRGGGVATYGFTLEGPELEHEEFGLAVPPGSERATNNVAEYVGAIRALEFLVSIGYRGPVLVFGDSQLVIRQMSGEYEVRAEHLRAYHEHLGALAARIGDVQFQWVPREENARADELSKRAIAEARRDAELRERLARRPPVQPEIRGLAADDTARPD
ncbi:MAG: ribonuclease HI family protein [Thermoplasmata archaeon]|nr:ribonuclease HI family protein [Thermoplasmata archaeon]